MQVLLLLLLAFISAHAGPSRRSHNFGNYTAIANRAAGTISLVNPRTLESTDFTLPKNGEPMYFAGLFFPPKRRLVELWVGDRANSRLVITRLKRSKIRFAGFLRIPNGTFHSMTTQDFSARRPKSFTTCDIANVTIVHDVRTRRRLCLLRRPKTIARLGAKPHDVTSDKKYAFVTYLGASDGFGYVASYRVRNCKLIRFIRTARDPHVAIRPNTKLWIAAQGGKVLSRSVPLLRQRTVDKSQPSPHGMFISYDLKHLYITNIEGAGINAIVVYNTATGKPRRCPQIDTTHSVPHNPTTSVDGKKLYLTHSIADDNITSAWDIRDNGCIDPDSERIIRTGNNPFGTFVLPPAPSRW